MPESHSSEPNIAQLDGNVSISSDSKKQRFPKIDHVTVASSLPIVASYNLRSLIPKVNSLKNDLLERSIGIGFLQEIWEQSDRKIHQFEIEKLLEIEGFQYISTPRPKNEKGKSYGGAAMIINTKEFSCEKLNVYIPSNLEIIWGLVKPKNTSAKFKKIIACSFYSPPSKKKNSKMADHVVSTLHMLSSRYPDSCIIIGADKNDMDISPILGCGLKLRQVVDKCTRKSRILDVIIMNVSKYYKSPIIAPPICPDNPSTGQPSDHSVPVCIPHTDRYRPPQRNYKIIRYRPLPESSVRRFGEWIVSEPWTNINPEFSPTEQAAALENLLFENLNRFCPEQEMKLSSHDKKFITKELKQIDRQKNREYIKRGKTDKYLKLKSLFDTKYKEAAKKYLNKNLEDLREAQPGKVFGILKKLGSRPGDVSDSDTFSLPEHERESLTHEQSAERIANHFASISQEFPPINPQLLPERVRASLESCSLPPTVSDYEVYLKMKAAKKPRSGVPQDLPKQITQEFLPELAALIRKIINSILVTGEWPSQWKLEQVIPIPKIQFPETEDDLRPISLTPFFSKVTEHFVVTWLLNFIGDKIDFRQYGGQKGNSVTHYIIEFVNFILSCQDSTDQTAILACMVDFQKAFNRQNHNVLITKLSDMGVPGWLLRIVISFLKDRKLIVNYKGKKSSVKSLPGGGPQGTILALLLFIVLINDIGFEGQTNNVGDLITSKRNMKFVNEIHLKYVDDLTLAEAIDMPTQLVKVPPSERSMPDSFHARTGHVLPVNQSKVYKQLQRVESYACDNDMKVNYKKTKLILFNPCKNIDFMPEFNINDNNLEVVKEIKLLGIIIQSDMKWTSNTKNMILKANKRLWILRRLKNLGALVGDLLEVYTKQIRCILEYAVPAWQSSITQEEKVNIERVQKSALHIILGNSYQSYENALQLLGIDTLDTRRLKLTYKFALRSEKHEKFRHWFKPTKKILNTRTNAKKYCDVRANHKRFMNSPISYLTKLLNWHHETRQ